MSFSSSSAVATGSRSPSPLTPEAFDSLDPVAIHSDLDLANSWYLSGMHPVKPIDSQPQWDMETGEFITSRKVEDDPMLRLDDLIEQHAYDECVFYLMTMTELLTLCRSSPSPAYAVSLGYPSPQSKSTNNNSSAPQSLEPVALGFSNILVSSRNGSAGLTKPIPPPAALPRKQDSSSMRQRVVRPPKESCYKCVCLLLSCREGLTKPL